MRSYPRPEDARKGCPAPLRALDEADARLVLWIGA